MASQLFLISYILDDQPMTCELHSEAETLSREEARRHLEALHRPHDAEAISDIQVSKGSCRDKGKLGHTRCN
ncbi:TPA: hypothetical protein L4718_003052 [Pseudomonas aeruginosa]|nr:hypothetical protein [Pseudomonas aeruginosa]HBO5782594.1 hypothetical protein [Pseudomonas aeruginosa]HBO6017171.1 hypothetical protein [Pseudomonas aeruginosa]HBO6023765.1 hypothetical protein [Pseudomonas aeruginosa]HBO6030407.1 hypothetical protein [Pseudomonas aeruginosa]